MDANVYKFLKLAFRKGDPAGEGKPANTASARRNHGVRGSAIPNLPRDGDIVSEEDLSVFTFRPWSATVSLDRVRGI
jgi:hypothetical protein